MNFEEAVQFLKSFISYEDLVNMKNGPKGFDLDRVREFADEYGVDYSKLRCVHVGGSKGKGSVSKIVAQYLYVKGESVGMFTSPYMTNITECFWLNGKEISFQGFVEMVGDLKEFIEREKKGVCDLTYFELLTLLVLKYFVAGGAEFAVLEVGLGGRLDSTNIVDGEVVVISTIEKEHTEILGETFEEIVGEKMGIVKAVSKVVVGWQNEEVMAILRGKLEGVVFAQEEEVIDFGCASVVQNLNANVALFAVKFLIGVVDMLIFEKALSEAILPGRFDCRLINGKNVVFDMAHTEKSVENLIKSLSIKFPDKKFVFLISLMKGKAISSILEKLKAVADKIVYTVSHDVRSEDPHVFCAVVLGEVMNDPVEAYAYLFNELKKDQVLVVTGSHFLVSRIFLTL